MTLRGIDMAPISTELVNNTYNGNFTGVYEATKGDIIDTGTGRSSEQYKIKNWTLNKSSNTNCGLFASIGAEGIVRNVCIENVVIKAKAKVGAIAGNCSGKIISCHTTGNEEASVRLQLRMLKSISEELSVISPRKAKFPIALIQRLLKGQPVVSVGL